MASILRSQVLRQSCLSATTRRVLSNKTSGSHILRPAAAISSSPNPLSRRPLAAAFHASSRRAILPPGPQVIEGDVNDPAPIPKPSPTHGSYHWTFERAISIGLVPLTIAPFAYGSLNPVLDAVLVSAILLHSHVGFTLVLPKSLVLLLDINTHDLKVHHYRLYPERQASYREKII